MPSCFTSSETSILVSQNLKLSPDTWSCGFSSSPLTSTDGNENTSANVVNIFLVYEDPGDEPVEYILIILGQAQVLG